MSVNVHRRDLDASQRVLLASRLSALSGEVTLSQAGEMVPSPAAQPVAPDPGAQGGRRPAQAHGETPPLAARDVVAPAHPHERLDPAAVVPVATFFTSAERTSPA